MEWIDFEKILMTNHIYTINNNSSLDIVLFGSCHMATIGFILNKLLNYNYNIHIIISWFFEKEGIENFDMNNINNRIQNIISKCCLFIHHSHIHEYGIDATKLPNIVNNNCFKLLIPNYRLDYSCNNYLESLNTLKYHIDSSSFPEFNFIVDNHKTIRFFNTPNHPTHYLLFLQTQAIVNKILKNNIFINLNHYYDNTNRNKFKEFNYVKLPGKENITDEISKKTGILINSDYFD